LFGVADSAICWKGTCDSCLIMGFDSCICFEWHLQRL